MPLLTLLIVLIIMGLVLWLVETQLPIAQPYKTVIRVVLVLVLILWLLSLIGVVPAFRWG